MDKMWLLAVAVAGSTLSARNGVSRSTPRAAEPSVSLISHASTTDAPRPALTSLHSCLLLLPCPHAALQPGEAHTMALPADGLAVAALSSPTEDAKAVTSCACAAIQP